MNTLSGILEWRNGAEGRIRQLDDGLIERQDDPFVPIALGDQYPLRPGQRVTVNVVRKRPRRRRGQRDRHPRAVVDQILEIEGLSPEKYAQRKPFEDLTPLDPQPRITLEHLGCPAADPAPMIYCGQGVQASRLGSTVPVQYVSILMEL